jgi:hypothetical protein
VATALGTRGFRRPSSDPSTDLQVRCHGSERDGRDVPKAEAQWISRSRRKDPEPHHLAVRPDRYAARAIHDSDSKRMEIADNRAYSGKQDRRPQDHCKIPGGLNFGADPFARRGCACMHVRTAIAGARSCRPLRHKPLRPRRPLRRNGHRRTSCARRAHGSCAASGRPRSPALWCPAERASAR